MGIGEHPQQLEEMDKLLGYLLNQLETLKIYSELNIIIVSDHGMVDVSEERIINIDDYNIPGTIHGKGPLMSIIDRDFSKVNYWYVK